MSTKLFEATLYKIATLSNLHVGNGEANFSVLDKEVQRDPITGFPQINASSLKGALREYITYADYAEQSANGNHSTEHPDALCDIICGSDPTATDGGSKKPKQGYMRFYDARLLSLPVRTNQKAFMRATSKEVLRAYQAYCADFGIACDLDINALEIGHTMEEKVIAEEWEYNPSNNPEELKELIGEDVILMEDEHFRELAKELPFVARNYLENGISKNLWYEEIVPRESQFYFVVEEPSKSTLAYEARKVQSKESDQKVSQSFETFKKALQDTTLFVGANTTVGYGKCKIEQIGATRAAKEGDDEQTTH